MASPGFLLTAVVAGVYVPGIVFSFVDVVLTKRLTLAQCWAVYWRAMKWYASLYVVAMVVFWAAPMTLVSRVPTAAPIPFELCRDLLLYFLLGDVVSYFWHRFEHSNRWYMKHAGSQAPWNGNHEQQGLLPRETETHGRKLDRGHAKEQQHGSPQRTEGGLWRCGTQQADQHEEERLDEECHLLLHDP